MVKIFIGNLASSTTEEELRSLFSQYGKISECDILKNYGFVHMNSQSEAEEAIRNLHHHELNGETMNVEMSKRRPKSTTKLHVSNIPEGCNSDTLKTKFEEYGPVAECDIVKDYAFVHMESVEDAMEAISKLDNTAFQGKLLSVQLSTSRLRTAPGMGDQTGCFVCGKQGHWSKDCPIGQNGSYDDGPGGGPMRGRGGRGRGFPPRGPPGYGRGGGYGMPGPSDYMMAYGRGAGYPGGIPPPPPPRPRLGYGSAGEYGRAAASYSERPSAYERERYGSSVDYYEKYRPRPYGSSYFEERHLSYIPPPPPPSSLSRLSSSSLDPYERRPLPPASAAAVAAAYYARDRSPIRRVPVTSESYTYERSRLSPGASARSATYTVARASDAYADRSRYATY